MTLSKNNIYVFSLFLLLLDSGGWLGVRELIVLLLLLISLKYSLIRMQDVRLYLIILILISVLCSIVLNMDNVPIDLAFKFAAPIFASLAFYFFNRAGILTVDNLSSAVILFCLFLITFFILTKLNVGLVVEFHNNLCFEPRAGYFCHTYNSLTGTNQPGFYFRSTLLIVPVALIFLSRSDYGKYTICLVAILISDTRAGLGLLIFFGFLVITIRNFGLWFTLVLTLSLSVFVISVVQTNGIGREIIGLSVRLLHIDSIITVMEEQNKILGMGPGSSFYSQGFGFMTNDSEVSPLEYYRRYGFFGLVCFHSLFAFILIKSFWMDRYYSLSLIAFYLATLTNPIMTSSFAFLFYLCFRENIYAKAKI